MSKPNNSRYDPPAALRPGARGSPAPPPIPGEVPPSRPTRSARRANGPPSPAVDGVVDGYFENEQDGGRERQRALSLRRRPKDASERGPTPDGFSRPTSSSGRPRRPPSGSGKGGATGLPAGPGIDKSARLRLRLDTANTTSRAGSPSYESDSDAEYTGGHSRGPSTSTQPDKNQSQSQPQPQSQIGRSPLVESPTASPADSGAPENALAAKSIAAFSAAARRKKTEEESMTSRNRADSAASSVHAAKKRTRAATNKQESFRDGGFMPVHPDTPAFREMADVLRRARVGFPSLFEDTERFNPTSVALGLLGAEEESSRASQAGQQLPSQNPTYRSFHSLLDTLDSAISKSLPSSYRPLLSSLTSRSSMLSTLTSAQKQVQELKRGLADVRENMVSTSGKEGRNRKELEGLWGRVKGYEEMERILDVIESLKAVPDKLESLMSEKRFLSAVIVLVRSLRTINKPEMMEIGAISDLRAYLHGQENAMLDILIEELNSHLYLKSYYCEGRWKAYTRGQKTLPMLHWGDDVDEPPQTAPESQSADSQSTTTATKLTRFLQSLSLKPSYDPFLEEHVDDMDNGAGNDFDEDLPSGPNSPLPGGSFPTFSSGNLPGLLASGGAEMRKNPEADSFGYIESLLESMACLGKLGIGLDTVLQRLPNELFALVESTVDEVNERYDINRGFNIPNRPSSELFSTSFNFNAARSSFSENNRSSVASIASSVYSNRSSSTYPAPLLRLSPAETTQMETNAETIRDLFWTLYSKLDAMLQGFRVAFEVSMRISERKDFKDASGAKVGQLLFSLTEVWKPVQSEVRSLLQDYLTDEEGVSASSRNPLASISDILRDGRFARDKSKQLFKFVDSDLKASSRILKEHEDEMNRALKAAVPGLVAADTGPNASQVIISTMVTDDRYGSSANPAVGGTHRVLVKPDAFNVSVLFAPTLAFLERVKVVMPSGLLMEEDRGFEAFLDDFVLSNFLPQLEEKVTNVFHQAVGGLDAFQEDPNWRNVWPVPVCKSVSNLISLIASLCTMLSSTPFHRENYSRLIFTIIMQFFQKCNDRLKELTMREISDMASDGLRSTMSFSAELAQRPDADSVFTGLLSKDLSDDVLHKREAEETKLLTKTRAELGRPLSLDDLIMSFKRLTAIGSLRSSLQMFIIQLQSLRPSPHEANEGQQPAEGATFARLPLTKLMAAKFDNLIATYQQLSDVALRTLRIELRAQVMYYLFRAMAEGEYMLEEDGIEPDMAIMDLNSSITRFDEAVFTTMDFEDQFFVFRGLPAFVDRLLISNATIMRYVNQEGASKMLRNIMVVQQNLRSLSASGTDDANEFERSRKYWELYSKGPKAMIESIRARIDYGFDEYKAMLCLQCGILQEHLEEGHTAEPPLSPFGDRHTYNEFSIELHTLVPEEWDD